MTGYLLDTNVVSEILRPGSAPSVVITVRGMAPSFLSVATVHELFWGVYRLPIGGRRDRLGRKVESTVIEFVGRVLPVDDGVARRAARFRADARRTGRVLDLADALIVATAHVNGLALVTRNQKHVSDFGVPIINPWTPGD